ncbi:hypothetical protein AB6H26_03070 [Providencia hangzhouensis]
MARSPRHSTVFLHRLTYRDQSRLVVDVPNAQGVMIENGHATTNSRG